MKKKGQSIFGMSFGTIFSIIVIIAIVVVAFIAIRHFLSLNRCSQVGFFYDDFEDKVQSVWTSGGAEDSFTGSLPSSGILNSEISEVCFGDLTKRGDGDEAYEEIGNELAEYYRRDDLGSNVYIYPPEDVCIPHKNVRCRNDKSNCITTDPEFFCVQVDSGEVTVDLSLRKGGGGPVTVSP
jgi:hypothetical protein